MNGCLCRLNQFTLTKPERRGLPKNKICMQQPKPKLCFKQVSMRKTKYLPKTKRHGELLTSTTDFMKMKAVKFTCTAIGTSERECTKLTVEQDGKVLVFILIAWSHTTLPSFRRNVFCIGSRRERRKEYFQIIYSYTLPFFTKLILMTSKDTIHKHLWKRNRGAVHSRANVSDANTDRMIVGAFPGALQRPHTAHHQMIGFNRSL